MANGDGPAEVAFMRVFLPDSLWGGPPAARRGFLAGWWLQADADAGAGSPTSQAVVASLVDAPSLGEARRRLHGAWGEPPPPGAAAPSVIGELLEDGGTAMATDQTPPYLLLTRSSPGGHLRAAMLGSPGRAATVETQVVIFQEPPAFSWTLRYLVGIQRPMWTVGQGADPGGLADSPLAAAGELLDSPPLPAALPQRSLPDAAALLCARAAAALSVVLCGLSRPALRLAAWGPLARWSSRSALLSECHRRLAVQSKWLDLLVSARAAALPDSYASRLLLLRSVSAVVCDVLLGLALLLVLHWKPDDRILEGLAGLSEWAYGGALVSLVDWLMGVPADFKLNKEFTSFVGSLCLSMFSLWRQHSPLLFLPYSIQLLSVLSRACCLCGISCLVALGMDILSLFSLPLLAAYAGIACCWKVFLRSLSTLVLLFMGKKYNILRLRVDHHNFDLEQITMGIILLSVFVFLSPSIFMYYVCFAIAWLSVVVVYSAMASAASFCNDVPCLLLLLGAANPLVWHRGMAVQLLDQPKEVGAAAGARQAAFRLSLRPLCWPGDLLALRAAGPAAEPGRGPGQRPGVLARLLRGDVVPLRHGIDPSRADGLGPPCGTEPPGGSWRQALASAWAPSLWSQLAEQSASAE